MGRIIATRAAILGLGKRPITALGGCIKQDHTPVSYFLSTLSRREEAFLLLRTRFWVRDDGILWRRCMNSGDDLAVLAPKQAWTKEGWSGTMLVENCASRKREEQATERHYASKQDASHLVSL